jgi:hypothetical protein
MAGKPASWITGGSDMGRSSYDEMHDRFERISTTNAGTRYERLAALVFKCFDDRQIVIHDIKLLGDTGVEHQIDVRIEVDGRPRHLLVECKDFDISGKNVGLDIVRNFWAVMDDTKPDEGIIISCNGFTEAATKYAKGKGIKLAVLRVFREADWENGIRIIDVLLNIFSANTARVDVHAGDEERRDRLRDDLAAVGIDFSCIAEEGRCVFLIENGESRSLAACVQERVNAFPKRAAGPAEVTIQSEGLRLHVDNRVPIPIERIRITFNVSVTQQRMEIGSHKIAELLLEGFGDSDLVIFDDDLKRFTIDADTGEVRPR